MKQKSETASGGVLFFAMLFLVLVVAYAQQPPPKTQPGVRIIEMKKAGLLYKTPGSDAQILKDDVVFYHEGAYMYCDSAYMYETTNSFDAFGHVRMVQGDTIFVYGDFLYYDGNTRLARLRENVRMEDKQATLFTDSLNYDRNLNLGYYFDGGMLVDSLNELTSFWGQYDPTTKESLFSDSVKLTNPDYIIFADTLKYNTESKIANILGPSVIRSDSGYINTTRGWYNTVTDESQLLDRSEVYSNDGSKKLVGDTIFYNQKTGVGIVHGNMFLQDTLRKSIIRGNYGYYNDKTEYALATDSAFAVDYSQKDSLFLHGDTLVMKTDTLGREIKAYFNVRFYREDIQGVCDSMQFVSNDSILYMYRDPVLWNQGNQISGDEINIHVNDSTIEKAVVKTNAMAIQSRNVENQYNQLSGRDLTANFRDGEIHDILVEGNATSLYYAFDEKDSTIIGLNHTESPFLSMKFKDRKLEKLKIWANPRAYMDPLSLLKPEDMTLKGFVWLDYLRPKSNRDIFRGNKRKAGDIETNPKKRFVRD
ncbi:MAG: hypothetical protein LBS52_09925 [Dysgonamonadaceae bacterium]|jgi:lipopolysaccharide export system protein LptA|nr:hypothetical protein [Dysgonamonadaceae bacterium]